LQACHFTFICPSFTIYRYFVSLFFLCPQDCPSTFTIAPEVSLKGALQMLGGGAGGLTAEAAKGAAQQMSGWVDCLKQTFSGEMNTGELVNRLTKQVRCSSPQQGARDPRIAGKRPLLLNFFILYTFPLHTLYRETKRLPFLLTF
jgi:hypothetical protein